MSSTLLRRLAAHCGISDGYADVTGVHRATSDTTRAALLAAMGIDTSTPASLRAAYHRAAACDTHLAAARVVEQGRAARLTLPLDAGAGRGAWELRVTAEDGGEHRSTGTWRGGAARLEPALPAGLPIGYHQLALSLRGGAGERDEGQTLIVVPRRCPLPERRLGARNVFGLQVNLYTVRSARDWGVGGFAELRALVELAAEIGAAFVGVNPLAALDNRAGAFSPYSPNSRLFANPLYLDVTAFPELAALPALRARLDSRRFRADLARRRAAADVGYQEVMDLKRPCFAALHGAFAKRHRDRATARGRAYAAFRARHGRALVDFATFLALRDHLAAGGAAALDWRDWPAPWRDPDSAAVRDFRAVHGEEVDLHCFLQFELERQLGAVARTAERLGMPLGLYQDLPIGSAPEGADAWAFQQSFLRGVTIGAPPDDYNTAGQDWGLPPLAPARLAADGYRYWIELLRASLRGAGALRIDHVMGLFRQYWIPAGAPPSQGAYVRYPADELLGILALEATRADALVIGEDLGTVPPEVPPLLAKWNILSTRLLYFSRDEHGHFLPARSYPRRCLVSANTHDLPTLAGFWSGRDLHIRRALGILDSDAALAAALAVRAAERAALVLRLRAAGLLPDDGVDPEEAQVRSAVHAFLCRTPARLVGIALDDLLGEEIAVNQPGVSLERYSSWTRRARLPLEALRRDAAIAAALAALRRDPRSLRKPGGAAMPG